MGGIMRKIHKTFIVLISGLGVAAAAAAAETVSYSYDSRGRLVEVEHSGNVNDGVITNYAYDDADNLTNKTTAGAP